MVNESNIDIGSDSKNRRTLNFFINTLSSQTQQDLCRLYKISETIKQFTEKMHNRRFQCFSNEKTDIEHTIDLIFNARNDQDVFLEDIVDINNEFVTKIGGRSNLKSKKSMDDSPKALHIFPCGNKCSERTEKKLKNRANMKGIREHEATLDEEHLDALIDRGINDAMRQKNDCNNNETAKNNENFWTVDECKTTSHQNKRTVMTVSKRRSNEDLPTLLTDSETGVVGDTESLEKQTAAIGFTEEREIFSLNGVQSEQYTFNEPSTPLRIEDNNNISEKLKTRKLAMKDIQVINVSSNINKCGKLIQEDPFKCNLKKVFPISKRKRSSHLPKRYDLKLKPKSAVVISKCKNVTKLRQVSPVFEKVFRSSRSKNGRSHHVKLVDPGRKSHNDAMLPNMDDSDDPEDNGDERNIDDNVALMEVESKSNDQ